MVVRYIGKRVGVHAYDYEASRGFEMWILDGRKNQYGVSVYLTTYNWTFGLGFQVSRFPYINLSLGYLGITIGTI